MTQLLLGLASERFGLTSEPSSLTSEPSSLTSEPSDWPQSHFGGVDRASMITDSLGIGAR